MNTVWKLSVNTMYDLSVNTACDTMFFPVGKGPSVMTMVAVHTVWSRVSYVRVSGRVLVNCSDLGPVEALEKPHTSRSDVVLRRDGPEEMRVLVPLRERRGGVSIGKLGVEKKWWKLRENRLWLSEERWIAWFLGGGGGWSVRKRTTLLKLCSVNSFHGTLGTDCAGNME